MGGITHNPDARLAKKALSAAVTAVKRSQRTFRKLYGDRANQRDQAKWLDFMRAARRAPVTYVEGGEFLDRIVRGQLSFPRYAIAGGANLSDQPNYGLAHDRLTKLIDKDRKHYLALPYFDGSGVTAEELPLHGARAPHSTWANATLIRPDVDYASFRYADLRGATISGDKKRTVFRDTKPDTNTNLEGRLENVALPQSWYEQLFEGMPYQLVDGELRQTNGRLMMAQANTDLGQFTREGMQPTSNYRETKPVPARRYAGRMPAV